MKKAAPFSLETYYTGTHHLESDGRDYRVLDAKALYAARDTLPLRQAIRQEPVFVWHPNAGESIPISGQDTRVAQGDETVFIKRLDAKGEHLKIYIPSGTGGKLPELALDEKYQPGVAYAPKDGKDDPVLAALPPGAQLQCRAPKLLRVPILHQVITEPSIIKHARGQGEHQTLKPGDSLEFEDGDCLPLPQTELDSAWQVQQERREGR